MNVRAVAMFLLGRLVGLVALLLIVSFGVFSLLFLVPGGVEQILLGSRPSNPDVIAEIRSQYHLDDSFPTQYWIWLKGAAHLDFGRSTRTTEPVLAGIGSRLGVTLFLGVLAFVIAMPVGVALGVASALRKRTIVDRTIVGVSVFGVSAPPFATGVLLLYTFAVLLEWFPAFGPGDGFSDRLWHLALPALALALTGTALVVKLTRAAMIEALDQDYVAFARARGLSRSRVVLAYAFRNALVPVVTAGGLILGVMLTGAVLVEVTFALPGVGSLLVESVTFKDVPMVQGVAMVVALTIMLVNLLTDVVYLLVDPRIRFERRAE